MNNNDKLYHSDIYLGQEYSDGLRHYKYLKKVKSPSGKWRYIYDESKLKKHEKISKKVEKQARSSEGYSYEDSEGKTHIRRVSGKGILTSRSHATISSLFSTKSKQSIKDKVKEKQWNIYEKHAKQKLKDIPKRVISKGIGTVNKILLNIEKKWIK